MCQVVLVIFSLLLGATTSVLAQSDDRPEHDIFYEDPFAEGDSLVWVPSNEVSIKHIQKRYNIFFRINSPKIDPEFKDNARTLEKMREDFETTLEFDGGMPDSLLILSTASPDGSWKFNQRLARNRAESTRKLLLDMFPEFEEATIKVEYLEEDWDGLLQVLRRHPEFPQREEMLKVINSKSNVDNKERELRNLKKGWRYLVNNYIYALRNSSITLVVATKSIDDEYVKIAPIDSLPPIEYKPQFVAPQPPMPVFWTPGEHQWRKTILAFRSNLLIPLLNIGMEIPVGYHWSVGLDYYYPWAVSSQNRWCSEMLGWFIDGKYWFTGSEYAWTRDNKLIGHALGVYAGVGYYDYQNISRGAQGEYLDLGIDYTYAIPISKNKYRLEFNLGLGLIRTYYRTYKPSSDYQDLIKDPGIKYHSTNIFGPTRASISFVVPITVKTGRPSEKELNRGTL